MPAVHPLDFSAIAAAGLRRAIVSSGVAAPATRPDPSALAKLAGVVKAARVSPAIFASVARLTEFAVLLALGHLIAALYVPAADLTNGANYVLAPLLTALVATSLFQGFGLYSLGTFSAPLKHAGSLILGWTAAVVALVASVFFLKMGPDFSRVWLTLWYAAGLAGIGASRIGLAMATRAARRAGRLTRNAIIYGSCGSGHDLIATLQNDPNSDIRICGIFDDRGDERSATAIGAFPCLGDIEALKVFSRSTRVDMLIMALPLAAESRVTMLLNRLAELPLDVRLAATASTLRFRPQAYSYIGSVPMIDLSDRPISGWNSCVKWLFDKTISTLAIVALAPVMAVVALAVKLESKGPVIFRQKRHGFNNELIEVFKFRSMYTDRIDACAQNLVTKNDPRVTRVGRVIRRASLDELPQLFNVLRGSLSLVGPRPHAAQAKAADRLYPEVVAGYFARHKVKPGITGWAQINGWRGETDTPEKIQKRVEYDMAYIENWSVWFDLYILLKTPTALLSTENAY